MSGHLETIICPQCKSHEEACVQHTIPFWSYVHHCTKCGYTIMESDWEEIKAISNERKE